MMRLFKKKRSDLNLSRQDVLNSKPVRNILIKWEADARGEVSIAIPQKDKLWVKIVSKIFMIPPRRVVVLDDVGSFVWVMCDSQNSIDDIIRSICKKYNLTRKEAETSLLMYLRQLGKRGMIGFAIPKSQIQNSKSEIRNPKIGDQKNARRKYSKS